MYLNNSVASPRERRPRKPLATVALIATVVAALLAGCSSSTSPSVPGVGGPASTTAGSPGGALVFYVQTEAGTPRAAVRRLDRLDGWCERAGGTQELMRIVRPAEDGHVARSSYAGLDNASPTVIQQTTEILATAAVSR